MEKNVTTLLLTNLVVFSIYINRLQSTSLTPFAAPIVLVRFCFQKDKTSVVAAVPKMSGSNNTNESSALEQNQMNQIVQCWDEAAQALQIYRQRVKELENIQQKKPDMVAYKELRHTWIPSQRNRQHGELPGVPIGLCLRSRGEAAILGIHQKILSGIDAIQGRSCYAVCISGGYIDDKDDISNGTIYYTGEGGQDKRGARTSERSKL